MNVVMEYIQPFTDWLLNHTEWALLLTFLISFGESLAVIGSIIPGSVVMTIVGILAGSGVIRIDLTLIAAVLGAIAGDWGSYLLGYVLRDRLLLLWPFKNHPQWLKYGTRYFERHGGKSILFGRFIGPLRSIIPVIAGMMRMRRSEFFLANALSAVAWSIAYVGPGILIGTASAELSAEHATRLFLLVIGFLIVSWLISVSLKWAWTHLSSFLGEHLNQAWRRALNIHPFCRLINRLTPPHEINHAMTAALVLLSGVCFLLSLSLILWIISDLPLASIDAPLYFFLQSVRTQPFDAFFIMMTFFVSPYPLLVLILSIALFTSYVRDWRALRYWISLSTTCTLLASCLNAFIALPPPDQLLMNQPAPLFPASGLALATACFSFLLLKLNTDSHKGITRALRFTLISLLLLTGTALIYLGDNWASCVVSAYGVGLSLCLMHWVFYRRDDKKPIPTPFAMIISLLLFACTVVGVACLEFKSRLHEHSPYPQQYVLTHHAWWNQRQPLLPLYTTNRLGRPIGLFNIQYLGTMHAFQTALESHGWKKQSTSMLQAFLLRAGAEPGKQSFVLKTPFYLSKKPMLTMTYGPSEGERSLILNLWRSNYHLINHKHPLWFGSIQPYRPLMCTHQTPQPLQPFLSALGDFEINTRPLSSDPSQALLMIKETTLPTSKREEHRQY